MTAANAEVLAFYKALPFNQRETVEEHAASVRRDDVAAAYPPLPPLLTPNSRVLEIGCGVGAFALSIAQFHRSSVTAVDFNPIAIARAEEIAQRVALPVTFVCADLFAFEPAERFDLVLSIGVLHHTNDCMAGLRRCIERFTRPGGHVLVGLYHAHGRRPFLEHFRSMARDGASEDTMLREYARLHHWLSDATHLYSWFRDQVLHPHETQHTLREVVDVASAAGADLVSTSINRFAPIDNVEALYTMERDYETLGAQRLREGTYFPGFFMTLLRKRP